MTLEMLKQNVAREEQIINEISTLSNSLASSLSEEEKKNFEESINLLESQLKMLNLAVPELINNISFYKPLGSEKEAQSPKNLLSIKYSENPGKISKDVNLAIRKKDEMDFLEKLSIHKMLSNKKIPENSEKSSIEKYASLINLANRVFRNKSNKLVDKGYFDSLKINLVKTTSPLLVNSYVSLMFFISLISVFFGLVFSAVLFALGLIGLASAILIFIFFPAVVLFSLYYAPFSKRKTLEKEINQELPFLLIYISAISTSGIEPSKIFTILLGSKDYPFTRREIKKLVNYLNFYGYDLVTALKLVAKNSPSERLSQLFDGIATTITSGGELSEFLNKHSESLLFDYRLEREKYTHIAETFMNIYISMVIAAPMIMMIVFILMSLTGFASGYLSPANVGLLTVLLISLLNLGFLVFLNLKQPKF